MSYTFEELEQVNEEKANNNEHDDFEGGSRKTGKKNYISSQYRIASISYALISCLLGLVVATVEPLKTCMHHLKSNCIFRQI
jgi:hypothetical protein